PTVRAATAPLMHTSRYGSLDIQRFATTPGLGKSGATARTCRSRRRQSDIEVLFIPVWFLWEEAMTKRWLVACMAAMLLLVHARGASAQAIKGELLGNIVDAGGLALPGVTVTITEVNTNISYTKTTNESGYYTFPSLKDGKYKVVAELTGFKKTVRDGVV